MTRETLIQILKDIPSEIDITLRLFNGQKVCLKSNTNINKNKTEYFLQESYIKIVSSAEKNTVNIFFVHSLSRNCLH